MIDSLGGGATLSGELALMPRSNALAGVNPALGVSVGSRQLTLSPDKRSRHFASGKIKQQTKTNLTTNDVNPLRRRHKKGGEAREVFIENHRYPIWFSREADAHSYLDILAKSE